MYSWILLILALLLDIAPKNTGITPHPLSYPDVKVLGGGGLDWMFWLNYFLKTHISVTHGWILLIPGL